MAEKFIIYNSPSIMPEKKKLPKCWLVTVDMGYGHQRAAYPLKKFAYSGMINANTYPGIPTEDRKIWHDQRKFYEFVSRFKRVPVLGDAVFDIMDWFQRVPDFYPKRNLSRPSLQLLSIMYMTKHKNWGKHLIDKLAKKPLPLVSTFFAPAFMAEAHNYPGDIYCLICDADISRSWVSVVPKNSRINYLAPNTRVVERLQLYGVPKNKIFLTGFPLPEENLDYPQFTSARNDLKYRLFNLDPRKKYLSQYKDSLLKNMKLKSWPKKADHPLTVTFAVGGAAAQRELGVTIVKSLASKISAGEIKINLIAGVHSDVQKYFKDEVIKLGLKKELGKMVTILFEKDKQEYMKKFNQLLKKTDILWTKPSELSFYCAIGLPIIIAPPIGSQEYFNQKWLINMGTGINQENPKYVNEWLFDWLNSGRLAESAAQGFLEAPKMGVDNISKVLEKCGGKVKGVCYVSQY